MLPIINLAINFFNALKVNSLECMSMINKKCMSRPKIIDINANEPAFYHDMFLMFNRLVVTIYIFKIA